MKEVSWYVNPSIQNLVIFAVSGPGYDAKNKGEVWHERTHHRYSIVCHNAFISEGVWVWGKLLIICDYCNC